jgi:hypothetical protein
MGKKRKRKQPSHLHGSKPHIPHDYGFGNAPLKPEHRAKTVAAINLLVSVLDGLDSSMVNTTEQLEAISHVKGQFTRTYKQDQWDWNTVWTLRARPSRSPASNISTALGSLRKALKHGDVGYAKQLRDKLRGNQIFRFLDHYLSGAHEGSTKGVLYLASTRSQPAHLYISATAATESAENDIKVLNASVGIIEPLGIRASWKLPPTGGLLENVYAQLSEYRIRPDRGFFAVQFEQAMDTINHLLGQRRLMHTTAPHDKICATLPAADSQPPVMVPVTCDRVSLS